MSQLIIRLAGHLTAWNIQTLETGIVLTDQELLYTGEHVFTGPSGKPHTHVYCRDRSGNQYGLFWPKQYIIRPATPEEVESFTVKPEPVPIRPGWLQAIKDKLYHWLWFWTPQGIAKKASCPHKV